jgi:2-dehydropantoate 2-reductase
MHTYLLGAGAIGGLFAAHLASKVPVTVLLRPSRLPDFAGVLRIRAQHDPAAPLLEARVRAEAVPPPAASSSRTPPQQHQQHQQQPRPGEAHIPALILATKANQALPALSALRSRLDARSVVVLLQNGVLGVHEQVCQDLFPHPDQRPAFILGSTTHGAYRQAGDPFSIVHAGLGTCVFGEPAGSTPHSASSAGGDSSRSSSGSAGASNTGSQHHHHHQQQQQQQQSVQAVMQTLASLSMLQPTVNIPPDQLQRLLLLKLVVNCCANPLSALLHCKNGGLMNNGAAAHAWTRIIAECKHVLGPRLPDSAEGLFDHVSRIVGLNAQNYNSMLQDAAHHRPTEIDYLNGYVVQHARRQGLAAPWNEVLCSLVAAREQAAADTLTTETLA